MKSLLLVFLLFLVGAAGAASFDCDRARSAQEVFVCRHPALSKLDERLDAAYRRQLNGLSPQAAAAVQRGQRSWLGYWPRVCSQSRGRVQLDEKSLDCVSRLYETRIARLSMESPLPGARIHDVSLYGALTSGSVTEYALVASHELSFPQFDQPAPGASTDRLVGAVNGWLGQDVAAWLKGVDRDSDTSFITTLRAVGAEILSAEDTAYFFGHGAAHGHINVRYRHFLVPESRPLKVEDLFRDAAWKDLFTRQAFDELTRRHGDISFFVKDRAAMRELVIDLARWSFEREGLVLNFAQYEVASYADGPQQVMLPWILLHGHLTDRGRRLGWAAQEGRLWGK